MQTGIRRIASILVVPALLALFAPINGCSDDPAAPEKKTGPDSNQLTWTWQHPLPQGHELFDVAFSNANDGTAVGRYGTILWTTDGGATWAHAASGTKENLYAVHFGDEDVFTAVGNNGIILRSTNGGESWSRQSAGTDQNLRGVFFTDTNIGTVVGQGIILRTTNGGNSWAKQQVGADIKDVYFTDAHTGVAVGSTILRTTDGGVSWEPATGFIGYMLNGVDFVSSTHGIAVGEIGSVYRTTDGGATWTGDDYVTGMSDLLDVCYTAAGQALAVGKGDNVFETLNGGDTWELVRKFRFPVNENGALCALTAVCALNNQTYFVAGDYGYLNKHTVGTSGSDDAWSYGVWSGCSVNLRDVDFIDANNGYAVGGHACWILQTNDGGGTWKIRSAGQDTEYTTNGVAMTSVDTAYVVNSYQMILRTTQSDYPIWYRQHDAGQVLNDVCFDPANNVGYAVGNNGKIVWKHDGGDWVEVASGTWADLEGVDFVEAYIGWAVGENGTILRSQLGEDWTEQTSGTTATLDDICAIDANTGVIVGSNGTILRTTDGGANWVKRSSGTTESLNAVAFADAKTGLAVGYNGTVLLTTNGGGTWVRQSVPTNDSLYGVDFNILNAAIIVGERGTIFRAELP